MLGINFLVFIQKVLTMNSKDAVNTAHVLNHVLCLCTFSTSRVLYTILIVVVNVIKKNVKFCVVKSSTDRN